MRADPWQYRLTCRFCGHVIDGPVDFEESQARAGVRAIQARSMDRKRGPIKYDNRGIV